MSTFRSMLHEIAQLSFATIKRNPLYRDSKLEIRIRRCQNFITIGFGTAFTDPYNNMYTSFDCDHTYTYSSIDGSAIVASNRCVCSAYVSEVIGIFHFEQLRFQSASKFLNRIVHTDLKSQRFDFESYDVSHLFGLSAYGHKLFLQVVQPRRQSDFFTEQMIAMAM